MFGIKLKLVDHYDIVHFVCSFLCKLIPSHSERGFGNVIGVSQSATLCGPKNKTKIIE